MVETRWELGSGCLGSRMPEAKVLLVSVVVPAPRVSKFDCAEEARRVREHDTFPFIFSNMYFFHLAPVGKKN